MPTVSDRGSKPPGQKSGRPKRDVVLVHGVTDDGAGVKVIRQRDDRLEAGAVMPVRDGQPLNGDLVTLRQRPELPLLFDVEVEYEQPRAAPGDEAPAESKATSDVSADADSSSHVGPARVANKPYRQGWDRIWGRASKRRLSN